MLWCRTACGYMWITRSPSTYPQKSRRRWRAGPRPASVAPMNDYEPIPGEPTATMFQSLEQIRRQTLQRCTATVGQSDRQLLFGMTTALELQGVPVPSHCNLDTAALHVTVRTRSGRPHIRPLKSVPVIVHIWSHCTPQSLIHISNGVHALHVFHVWAQLSPYLSTEDLVVLGDSISHDAGTQWRAGRGQIVSGVAAFHKRDAAVPRKKHLQASHDTGTPQYTVSRRKLATAGRSTPRNTGWTMQCRGSWNHLSFRSSHFAGHRMGRVQGRSGI